MSNPARTYNQNHIPRKYTPGKRRLSIYWTWSYPWESQRDLTEMDNRFSTMTEVRRVAWPNYERPEWGSAQFLQGIAGTLELFHRSALSFQRVAEEATGAPRRPDPRRLEIGRARVCARSDHGSDLPVDRVALVLSRRGCDGRGAAGGSSIRAASGPDQPSRAPAAPAT